MATLYFDDVAIGDAVPPLKKGPVTLTDLVKYSGASGDFNPLHTVPEYAKQRAGLPDVIAHGMLSMAYAGQLITNWIGTDGEVKRLKAQFRAMTFLNDEVTCEGIVADKRQTKDGNLVDVNIVLSAGREGRRTVVGSATVALPARAKRKTATTATKKKAAKKKAAKKKATKKKTTKKNPTKKKPTKKKTAKKKAAKKKPARKRPAKKKAAKKKATKKKAGKRRRR